MGVGGQGAHDLAQLQSENIVALCDVDEGVLNQRLKEAAEKGRPAVGYTDLRKMLEDKNIDVTSLRRFPRFI